jgi:hypothetical protein
MLITWDLTVPRATKRSCAISELVRPEGKITVSVVPFVHAGYAAYRVNGARSTANSSPLTWSRDASARFLLRSPRSMPHELSKGVYAD